MKLKDLPDALQKVRYSIAKNQKKGEFFELYRILEGLSYAEILIGQAVVNNPFLGEIVLEEEAR